MKLLITYAEPLYETPAAIIWKKFKKKFRDSENFYFWKPDLSFDKIYQNLLVRMLKKEGYINVEKTHLDNYNLEDWRNLRKEWDELWNEHLGGYYIMAGKYKKDGTINFYEEDEVAKYILQIAELALSGARDFWINEVLQAMEEENCDRGLILHSGTCERIFPNRFLEKLHSPFIRPPKTELYLSNNNEVDEKITNAFKKCYKKIKIIKGTWREPLYDLEMFFWGKIGTSDIPEDYEIRKTWFLPRYDKVRLPPLNFKFAELSKYQTRISLKRKENKKLMENYQKRLEKVLAYLEDNT